MINEEMYVPGAAPNKIREIFASVLNAPPIITPLYHVFR